MTAQVPITAAAETGGGVWRFPADRPLRLDSGATLAPVVAELLAEEITGGSESPLLVGFRPARFE